MQEYWEAYVKPIDGHKAMVSFNAGISDTIPNEEYLHVGFVKVKLHDSKEDGLATQEEADDIGFIEDRLEMESLRWRTGKYIGRIISNAEVTFIYYLKLTLDWENAVSSAIIHFPEYKYEFGSRLDTEWEVYQKLLFPTTKEWQIIVNHHTCDALIEKGDNLRLKRAIEHKAYFKNEDNRKKFATLIEEEGFKNQKEVEILFDNNLIYGVHFYKVDIPYYYNIDELTMTLIDLSHSCEGLYDGWESSLVKL